MKFDKRQKGFNCLYNAKMCSRYCVFVFRLGQHGSRIKGKGWIDRAIWYSGMCSSSSTNAEDI